MYKFKFADIGEGLHEGVVGEIYKKKGDDVQEGESLFSVETDKVTSDIPSPTSGKIIDVLAKVGDTIHVGDVIYHIDDGSATSDSPEPSKEVSSEDSEAPKKEEKVELAASVVGDISVSNNLFSSDMFKKPPTSAPSEKKEIKSEETPTSTEKIVSTSEKSASTIDINNINPTGSGEKVDVVVIGAGPGGYTVGEFLARDGLKTVVIEKEYAGGVCLNVGCIPTKTLLKSSKVIEDIRNAAKYGIDLTEKNKLPKLNWKVMQERKEDVANKLKLGVETLLKSVKAEFIIGDAKILDRYNVKVGKRTFTTKIIVVSTGSSPIMIPLPGFDKALKDKVMINSSGALSLPKIPKTLIVIGGGVIGVEFAVLYQSLGTKVTILEGANSILAPLDKDLKKFASDMIKDLGIDVKTNAMVKSYKDNKISYESDGKKYNVAAEKILLSVGRKPNNINIDKTVGVKLGSRGEILVNSAMQTNVDNIFAIGDVTAQSMLAHTAYKHAHVVVNNIRGVQGYTWDINEVPACVYTHPELSMIGKTEDQLIKEGANYIKSIWLNKNVGKVLADGDSKGFTKLLIDKETGAILGAHIANSTSSDMIAEIAAVIKLEGTVYELADTIHPHPSISEGIYEAAVHAKVQLDKEKRG